MRLDYKNCKVQTISLDMRQNEAFKSPKKIKPFGLITFFTPI
jgi:hypothetical protein